MWSPKLTRAFDFAAQLHRGQFRKGGTIPYLSHLLGVASLVLENQGTEDLVIAALLHDAVEDQGGRQVLDLIRKDFGDRVAEVVERCSDTTENPKPPWKARKANHIELLRRADAGIRLVSAADKLHNLRSIRSDYRTLGEKLWTRFRGDRDDILWYYREMVGIFQELGPPHLAHELEAVLEDLISNIERNNGSRRAAC